MLQVKPRQADRIQVKIGGIETTGYVMEDGHLYIADPPPQQGQQGQGNGAEGELKRQPSPMELLAIPKDLTFQKRLESTLKDNALNRVVHNLKRGKLDTRSLHKVEQGSENVFKRKKDVKGKKYNIALLVDESGSMQGPNIRKAAQLAAFLQDNFQSIDIDLAVMGYAHYTEYRKQFDEVLTPEALQKRIIGNFIGGGTDDYKALRDIYNDLKNREGESIVIVLSDGDGCEKSLITPLVENNRKIARTVAIGIGTECRAYPLKTVVNGIDQLKPAVLNILNGLIIRG